MPVPVFPVCMSTRCTHTLIGALPEASGFSGSRKAKLHVSSLQYNGQGSRNREPRFPNFEFVYTIDRFEKNILSSNNNLLPPFLFIRIYR